MFEGKLAGKGLVDENSLSDQFDNPDYVEEVSDDSDTDMMMLLDHSGLSGDLKENFGYKIVKGSKGLYGIVDNECNELVPCRSMCKITLGLTPDSNTDKDGSETDDSWIDLISGVRFGLSLGVTRKGQSERPPGTISSSTRGAKSKWIEPWRRIP